jgi:hypothetical protein
VGLRSGIYLVDHSSKWSKLSMSIGFFFHA